MAYATAKIRYIKASPQKLRLLAHALRRQSLTEAEWIIKNTPRRYSQEFWHALTNARAILQDKGVMTQELMVSKVTIDQAPRLKRFRPVARGHSAAYQHAQSHLSLTLTDELPAAKTRKNSQKTLQKDQDGTKS